VDAASSAARFLGVTACVVALFDHWNPLGHSAFAAVIVTSATFLSYAAFVIFAAHLGPWSLAFAVILFFLQFGTLALLIANMFEIIDVICRTRWSRIESEKSDEDYRPKVSLHVPIHSEPPELVIETLDALANLDYPDYEVLVIDNNTAEEELWRPIEAYCAAAGPKFRFFHLMPWPGYKSGALNFALAETAPEAEIIGVIDADYVAEPGFLSDLVGHFSDSKMAFVQTPQDYRDQHFRGRYGKALYLSYLYFFKVSMANRNEYNAIIYAGTMGLVRKSALEKVGGWSEWCITEDAELSLRLLAAGYKSLYIDQTYGRGLMPLDYAGLKKQRFRWAFGGMQILKLHWRSLLLPWAAGNLTWAQRLAYLNGGFQWLSDPITLSFTVILLIGATTLLVENSVYSHPLAGGIVMIPPLFIMFALLRFIWALRIRAKASLSEALDALTILLGLTWVVSLACLRGLASNTGVFLRTPKQGDQPRFFDSIRIVKIELFLGMICVSAAILLFLFTQVSIDSALGIIFGLLLWQAAIYLAAVRSSFWSYFEHNPVSISRFKRAFRNVGHQVADMITEVRAAILLGALIVGLSFLFFFGKENAPEFERIQIADPMEQFLPARSLLVPREREIAGALLFQEAVAAQQQDIDAALRLWDPNGVIDDTKFSGRVWRGTDQLKERYVREFSERQYISLHHTNMQIEIDGDNAVIVNDLHAVYDSEGKRQIIHIRQSDRWTLRRTGDRWQIIRLEKLNKG
jgi:cellulose synthase/poly-beta-1,6-N-acetylglucosamine synthase-like glycosyltransferase